MKRSIGMLMMLLYVSQGIRVPGNCGRDGKILITSKQFGAEDVWASNYTGLFMEVEFKSSPGKIIINSDNNDLNYELERICNHDKTHCVYLKKSSEQQNIFSYDITLIDWSTSNPIPTIRIKSEGPTPNRVDIIITADNQTCSIKDITFRDCKVQHPLVVESNSSRYGDVGVFSCEDDSHDLLYDNTTLETTTKCLANAEWENKNSFRCLTAPRIRNHSRCDWVIGRQNSCSFQITAIPFAEDVQIFSVKDGSELENVTFTYQNTSEGYIQNIIIETIEANEHMEGLLLVIKSPEYPDLPLKISINIVIPYTIHPVPLPANSTNTLIVGISVGVTAIFALIIILVLLMKRKANRRRRTCKKRKGDVSVAINAGTVQVTRDVDEVYPIRYHKDYTRKPDESSREEPSDSAPSLLDKLAKENVISGDN